METTRIQVLDRALDIIEQLASTETGMSIAQLSSRTGLPKSTIHRILNTLVDRDYLDKESVNSVYSIGPKFVEVSSGYLNSISLKTEAQPIMHELAMAYAAVSYLGVLDKGEVMYLEKVEQFHNFRFYTQIGKREPLYCTGLGKILLAALPNEDFFRIAESLTFVQWTDNTIMDVPTLFTEIEEVRRTGYALDRYEHDNNHCCIAVPIFDYTDNVIAAMSISGHGLLEKYGELALACKLREASKTISRKMGHLAPKEYENRV